jgi:FdhD protein
MNPDQQSERAVGGMETQVWCWPDAAPPHSGTDTVAREEPLEIRVRGQSVAVTMRTPGHDEELAAGFLYTEGLIRNRDDVTGISFCRQGEATDHANTLNVFLNATVEFDLERLTRHFYASSSCGLCGKASIDSIHQLFPPIQSHSQISPGTLLALPDRLRAAQPVFDATGGLHAAGLFDLDGNPICVREDVGRHNAVDKVVGAGFLGNTLPYEDRILVVSGRASFEIVQKALAARIPIIAALSAPSSLAVEAANDSGQTLIGFLRDKSFQVYSHPNRVSA